MARDAAPTAGGFSPLGAHFAQFLRERNGAPCAELALAATLVSRAVETGHVCVHLGKPHPDLWDREADDLPDLPELPETQAWTEALLATRVVGTPGEFKPLILDVGGRLYLQRYWAFEKAVADFIEERANCLEDGVDAERLRAGLDRYFPETGTAGAVDWQRVAAVTAVLRPFSVIAGGPGTGKTTTVVKILGLLVEQDLETPPRIALAAPTGKAATRLKESIRAARDGLDAEERVRAAIPADVSTLHRLLGYRSGRTEFRHNAVNPLPVDVLVVDEASMVALPMMARVTAALPLHAKLILLGDHNQLASVEAGAVLGDICGGRVEDALHSRDWAARLNALGLGVPPGSDADGAGGLADAITVLRTNYRFSAESSTASVSTMVNRSDAGAVLAAVQTGLHEDLMWRGGVTAALLEEALREIVIDGYGSAVETADPQVAHDAFGRFRILCATRRGGFGVEAVNRLAERILADAGRIRPDGRWYAGRPVMVTRNDYHLGVFNGDVGVTLPSEAAGGDLRVFFAAADGGMRAFAPTRVPEHETAYAMTVHKSQGSEFDRVLLLLGDRPSRVLTRELVYTGMTRARSKVEIWGTEEVLHEAVTTRIERSSGLRERLWAD